MKKRIVALVPMRHHSQRVSGKNFRPLAGIPLFHHILSTLKKCPEIDQVIVDTDSSNIIGDIEKNFPEVLIIDRPEHLRADDIPMNEVLTYDVNQVEADFYLQTHSTNPLLCSDTISSAIQEFLESYPVYNSLFSVTRLQTRLWDQLAHPINHNPAILLQTQDLPPVFEENSCLYIFTKQLLLESRNRIGERPMMFPIDAAEAWDIDNELDFAVTDFLMQYKVSKK